MTPRKFMILLFIFIVAFTLITLLRSPKNVGVIYSACSSFNGIVTCFYKVSLMGATTTPCSIRSPAATSSIIHASVNVQTAATSSVTTAIGKSDNTGTIATELGSLTLATNEVGTLVATSTLNTSDNLIINPLNYVNATFSTNYSSALTGNCEVIFRVL